MKLGKKLPIFFTLFLAASLLAGCGKNKGGNGGEITAEKAVANKAHKFLITQVFNP